MKKESLWLDTAPPANFSPLHGDIEVDVLVVGGGITGLTTAYLLKKAGCRVAVVDQQEIASGETAHTTAHVTYVTDSRLNELASKLGNAKARAFWQAGLASMRQIEAIAAEFEIDCELRSIPGFLFAAEGKDAEKEAKTLLRDAELAIDYGFDANFVERDPLFHRPAARFPNQLKFHPLKYVTALARAIPGNGCHVFSKTCGSNIDGEKHELRTDCGSIRYQTLVAATHVPIQGERGALGATLFQTKLAAYSTYAIEAAIEPTAEALFWDTNDPYLYLRIDRRGRYHSAIIGGEDHKTGQAGETEAHYERLEEVLKKIFPNAKARHRWSGQVLETPDGLPYIGEVAERQFLATGFSGNGMTLGTFSGMLLRDLITGKSDPWNGLFAPSRKSLAGAWEYLRENIDYPTYFLKDHLHPVPHEKPEPGTGAVVKIDGKKKALYCDEKGKCTALNPVCPHMGCIVAWNDAEKTWDCPCHGSRFTGTGDLIAGPAESGLEPAK